MIDVDVLKERALKDPKIKAEYDLAVLLGAITPENVHEEVDFGAAVGQELGARHGRPKSWDGLIDSIKVGGVPPDFFSPNKRGQGDIPPRVFWISGLIPPSQGSRRGED